MIPRVAFFTDSFHETNGVALTSRQFASYSREQGFPFLSVHAGPRTAHTREGVHETLELASSRALLHLEHDLYFDLMFWRHRRHIARVLRQFRPDLVHITGPNHVGILGWLTAYDAGAPLVASWHTNVHEFAGRRLKSALSSLPVPAQDRIAGWAESASLGMTLCFYQRARLLFAPNRELTQLLERRTGRPAYLMERGIDTQFYSPAHRIRTDRAFVIGCVGRLSAEKNVRLLAALEHGLRQAGITDYRFLVVGEGGERAWLRENLQQAELPGLLRGIPLAEAYANMDVFVFPSETDTYGNVAWEALASGVPAIVSDKGGPKFIVRDGITGFVASDADAFTTAVVRLYHDPALRARMAAEGRKEAEGRSWKAVFDGIYETYRRHLASGVLAPRRHWWAGEAETRLS